MTTNGSPPTTPVTEVADQIAKAEINERPRVGPALRVLREATGLSLREFAERAGFDHAFVSRVERDVFRPKASWLESYLETAGEALAGKVSS
jgi:predicted transcriptional regulator